MNGEAESLPMWERGLKQAVVCESAHECAVAPHVGAWIETLVSGCASQAWLVAPHVGAWIETLFNRFAFSLSE